MSYLLDTHVWLWMVKDPSRIPEPLLNKLRTATTLHLSVACIWEIAIKHALGKLPLPSDPERFCSEHMRRSGVRSLPLQASHALRAAALPRHHNDPFDRLLVAQAQIENLPLVSTDSIMKTYDVELVDLADPTPT